MFIQNTFSDSSLTVLLVSLLVFYPISEVLFGLLEQLNIVA